MDYTCDPTEIQHIVRMFNTNIEGAKQLPYALTKVPGIGIRFSMAMCKRMGFDLKRRAGSLTDEEVEKIQKGFQNPAAYGIPEFFMNHNKDPIDGTTSHLIGTKLDGYLRMKIERGKKIKHVRICRLAVGLKIHGQKTKSNGRGKRVLPALRKK